MVADTQFPIVCEATGRRRISFRATWLGIRPHYQAEHVVAYHTTNPYQDPIIVKEWITVPIWKAYAGIFYSNPATNEAENDEVTS